VPKSLLNRLSSPAAAPRAEPGFLTPNLSPHTPAPPLAARISHRLPAKPEHTSTYRPLRDRFSSAQPINTQVDLHFSKNKEVRKKVFEKRVEATIKRTQAIYNLKKQFHSLPEDKGKALNKLGDYLEVLLDYSRFIITEFDAGSLYQVEYLLLAISRVSFKQLKLRYDEVVTEVLNIYFDDSWVTDFAYNEEWKHVA
jgi:hypothetical protein